MIRNGRLWPWAIVLVLGLTVGGNLWVMRLAGSDPSFAIEPNYYRQAVNWDSTMAQATRNDALGWALTARLGAPLTGGHTEVVATLRDASGEPLTGATVRVAASHNARGAEILTAELTDAGNGRYVATIPAARRGLWELRFEAERSGDEFTATIRADNTRDPAR